MVKGDSGENYFKSKERLESLALDERLRLDKNADPKLIAQALDDLADVNFRALDQPILIMKTINQTLAKGLSYPSSPGNDLSSLYSTLKNTLSEMIKQVDNLSESKLYGKHAEEYQKVLDKLDYQINPTLDTIDRLFRFGYHIPSPLPKSQTTSEVNVLSMLDCFNSVFKEPVKNAHHLLSGGAKPNVDISNVETVEDLVRVLHDVGLERFRHLFHNLIYKGYYNHLKKVRIFESKDFFVGPLIVGLGHLEVSKFKNSPMWPIAEALIEYAKNNNEVETFYRDKVMKKISALMTTRSLSSIMELNYSIVGDTVNCSLYILYDVKQKSFSINFLCGNKGYFSQRFMDYVKESFSSKEYKYSSQESENKEFWLDKKSYAESAKQDVRFIFDNLKEKLLMSYKSR